MAATVAALHPSNEPACVNCGGTLETSLYCATCVRGDSEPWFQWRDRLRRIRDALAAGARRP